MKSRTPRKVIPQQAAVELYNAAKDALELLNSVVPEFNKMEELAQTVWENTKSQLAKAIKQIEENK